MRSIQFLSILSALACLTACGGEINTVQIESFRVPCVGFINQMCLVTQNETEDEPTLDYDTIHGFDYEWGKTYELITETTEISNPPQDASSLRVELVEVVKAEPVAAGTTFSFVITPEQYRQGYRAHVEQVNANDNSIWKTLDEQVFICPAEVCVSLVSALEGDANASLEFEFQEDLALILQSVTTL